MRTRRQRDFYRKNIGFGHRRLSILDISSSGHQPFSPKMVYVMTYNGEIYNFKRILSRVKSNGFDIKTTSDTEVLMKLFQLHGLKCSTASTGCLPLLFGIN
jgi:asparagine synthase (glutamine-hydrolysing)